MSPSNRLADPSRIRNDKTASQLASSTENRIVTSLSSVVTDLDVTELRIFLRRFDGVDVELEAHRFASVVAPETRPLRAFENWLAKAKPAARVQRGKSKALHSDQIDQRLERIRRNIEDCEVFGERFLSPEEVEQNLAFFREKLEARR